MSDISGQLLIAGVSVTGVGAALRGVNPATAENCNPSFANRVSRQSIQT